MDKTKGGLSTLSFSRGSRKPKLTLQNVKKFHVKRLTHIELVLSNIESGVAFTVVAKVHLAPAGQATIYMS